MRKDTRFLTRSSSVQFSSTVRHILSLSLITTSLTSIYHTDEKGISKRFLDYFQKLDTTLGAKALGPDQTISGKVTSTIQSAHKSARSVDEQKGYSKTAGDVCLISLV